MPTAQDLTAAGYERQGEIFRILSEMAAGVASKGAAYITATLWEALRSFHVGWKWSMDALSDGFRAAAYDPSVGDRVIFTLGGVADNASKFYGSPIGGRGYLASATQDALRATTAYNSASESWGSGLSQLIHKAAELYASFWQNAP